MTPGFHMENKTFNQMFDRVSAKLPFTYGILTAEETNDPNKTKMEKRNLKIALKTYVWGSFKSLCTLTNGAITMDTLANGVQGMAPPLTPY